MQRELKFRAWDILQSRFLYPYPNGFDILGETTCFDLIGSQIKEFTPEKTTLERLNDVEITQFTGLKDKNGKDIYEGDVLKFKRNSISKRSDIRVVKFNRGCFLLCRKNNYMTMQMLHSDLMEIIGNIYENPKLVIGLV
jgi:uncharacterized phage protein (TIGR01671 family)